MGGVYRASGVGGVRELGVCVGEACCRGARCTEQQAGYAAVCVQRREHLAPSKAAPTSRLRSAGCVEVHPHHAKASPAYLGPSSSLSTINLRLRLWNTRSLATPAAQPGPTTNARTRSPVVQLLGLPLPLAHDLLHLGGLRVGGTRYSVRCEGPRKARRTQK